MFLIELLVANNPIVQRIGITNIIKLLIKNVSPIIIGLSSNKE